MPPNARTPGGPHPLRSRSPRRAAEQSGYTIIETLIVVIILSIVLAVLYKGLDGMQLATQGSEERLVNLEEARVMMATVTKDLRTAARLDSGTSPFVLAGAREMIFYANLGNTSGPSKVRIYVDAENRLIEQVTPPDAGSAPNYTYTGTALNKAVSSFVVPSLPIFKYQYFNNSTLAFTDLSTVPLSQPDRDKVQSVEITISMQKPSAINTPATTLVNRVRLSNVYFNPATEGG